MSSTLPSFWSSVVLSFDALNLSKVLNIVTFFLASTNLYSFEDSFGGHDEPNWFLFNCIELPIIDLIFFAISLFCDYMLRGSWDFDDRSVLWFSWYFRSASMTFVLIIFAGLFWDIDASRLSSDILILIVWFGFAIGKGCCSWI